MSTKITSAEAFEYVKTGEFNSYPLGQFDRISIETLLREAGNVCDFTPPSAKSFLDWARREGVVVQIEGARGRYRWVEDEAAEIGRQIAQETLVQATDMDPEFPMILTEDEPETITGEMEVHLSEKRVSRRRKREIKRHYLSDPAISKVTVRCGREPLESIR